MKSPSKGTSPLLSAALGYAERGWRVFPLIPRDKRPITSDGFKSATSVRSTVLAWWQQFPDANIGLATGDPFDVLDLDGPSGVPYLHKILGTNYRHSGPVAITGKGWHFFFEAAGLGNRAGLLGGKVDYRGTGGYVVAPPSIHPSGRQYKWDPTRDDNRPLPPLGPLADVVKKPSPATPHGAGGIVRSLPSGMAEVILTTAGNLAAQRPDIVMVAESIGLPVTTKGVNYVTNCIFHDDPGPSMVLYTGQNKFYCYGCEAHGDSRDLAERKDMTGRKAR